MSGARWMFPVLTCLICGSVAVGALHTYNTSASRCSADSHRALYYMYSFAKGIVLHHANKLPCPAALVVCRNMRPREIAGLSTQQNGRRTQRAHRLPHPRRSRVAEDGRPVPLRQQQLDSGTAPHPPPHLNVTSAAARVRSRIIFPGHIQWTTTSLAQYSYKL